MGEECALVGLFADVLHYFVVFSQIVQIFDRPPFPHYNRHDLSLLLRLHSLFAAHLPSQPLLDLLIMLLVGLAGRLTEVDRLSPKYGFDSASHPFLHLPPCTLQTLMREAWFSMRMRFSFSLGRYFSFYHCTRFSVLGRCSGTLSEISNSCISSERPYRPAFESRGCE